MYAGRLARQPWRLPPVTLPAVSTPLYIYHDTGSQMSSVTRHIFITDGSSYYARQKWCGPGDRKGGAQSTNSALPSASSFPLKGYRCAALFRGFPRLPSHCPARILVRGLPPCFCSSYSSVPLEQPLQFIPSLSSAFGA